MLLDEKNKCYAQPEVEAEAETESPKKLESWSF